VVAAPPKPPDREPEAERLWDVIVPELEQLRLVSRLDGVTLEALCVTYARWKRHDGGHGYAALTNVLAKLARDVGLAPAARQRMAAPASDPGEQRAVFGGNWSWTSYVAPASSSGSGQGSLPSRSLLQEVQGGDVETEETAGRPPEDN
jgi:phage terminase small subunit